MTRTLRLTSADAVIDALGTDHPAVRLKVTLAIGEQPELLARYGAEGADTIVRTLWERLQAEPDATVRQGLLHALRQLPHEAVVAHCTDILDRPDHALAVAAATVLAGHADDRLPVALRLRVRLLAGDDDAIAASLDAGYAEAWLDELAGPYGPLARQRLAPFPTRALELLAPHLAQLAPEGQAWLVSLLNATTLTDQTGLLDAALASQQVPVLVAALRLCAEQSVPEATLVRALALGEHAHPDVRLAACRLPITAALRSERYGNERDSRVRAALLRDVDAGTAEGFALLIAALENGGWRERTAAVEACVAHGTPVIPRLRQAARQHTGACRAAASQALLRLGDETWLEAAAFSD
ncbi:MAG: hypothetical protein OQL11_01555 [Gammaproteobacteria bacterium]|nr:hypothetical protein [Gammaproteobacteria bacterium]